MSFSVNIYRIAIFFVFFISSLTLFANALPTTSGNVSTILEKRVPSVGPDGFRVSTDPRDWSSEAALRAGIRIGKSKACFWSGKLRNGVSVFDTVQQIAREESLSTLEVLLAKGNLVMPTPDLVSPEATAQWEKASKVMADASSGDVIAVIGRPLKANNVYEKIELPALRANSRVNSVTEIDANSPGTHTVVFSRRPGAPPPGGSTKRSLEEDVSDSLVKRAPKGAAIKPAAVKPPTAKPPTVKPAAKPPTAKPPKAKTPAAKPPVKPATVKPPKVKPATVKPPKPAAVKPPKAKPATVKPPKAKPPTVKPPKAVKPAPKKPAKTKTPKAPKATKTSSSAAPSKTSGQTAPLIPDCKSSVIRCR